MATCGAFVTDDLSSRVCSVVADDPTDTVREYTEPTHMALDSEDLFPIELTHSTKLPEQQSRRFTTQDALGEGGMGKVDLIHDDWIGRRVARKSLRPELLKQPKAYRSFFREARVQGQLEHPAIVPVHDLGFHPDGSPYFVMKRIRGRTLSGVLAEGEMPLRRILEAFARVCLAIDYAHKRGVVHRDLKPDNIMLGDFGEIYVLDWGIAQLQQTQSGEALEVERTGESGATRVPVGTPLYMAPEQVACTDIDARTDVYALGAILFEILTGRVLRNTKDVREALSMAMLPSPRASRVAKDREIPPELDEACALALAVNMKNRLPSVRALSDYIQRYLDGDRDLELRLERSREHLTNAMLLLETATLPMDESRRRDAAQEATRAIALDPDNRQAQALLIELMLEPPKRMPNKVREKLAVEKAKRTRAIALSAGGAYGASAISIVIWSLIADVRIAEALIFGIGALCITLATLGAIQVARSPIPSDRLLLATFVTSTLAMVVMSRALAPTILTPIMLATNCFGFILVSSTQVRRVVIAGSTVTPIVLWFVDRFDPTTVISGDSVTITSQLYAGPGTGSLYAAVPFVVPILIGVFAWSFSRVIEQMEKNGAQVELQRWRLRQLLPRGVGSMLTLSAGQLTREQVMEKLQG